MNYHPETELLNDEQRKPKLEVPIFIELGGNTSQPSCEGVHLIERPLSIAKLNDLITSLSSGEYLAEPRE